uniref:Predicted protein n=1 Tax=Hordeum vulgare subsp. vulgare TaxID=112509 RepID=F2EKG8_HORVV|nr:predicted protein [Hordeum vulgare subsp. vulgare]
MWPVDFASPVRSESLEMCDLEDLQHHERANTLQVATGRVRDPPINGQPWHPLFPSPSVGHFPMSRESISVQERWSSGGLRKRSQRWSTSNMSLHVALMGDWLVRNRQWEVVGPWD